VARAPQWSVPEDRLETRFADKKKPFEADEALVESARCLYCYDAPCIPSCPTNIDIPTFIRKIATRNLRGAARTILTANLLGKSCSQACPVEVLCEGTCVYVGWGQKAVEIGRLQRYAMDRAQSADLFERAPATGRSIGLVGAGPASLACAGRLALLGHETVLYEKADLPGGLNITGIAPYKLQATEALQEVEFIRSLGVTIHTGVEIGRDVSPQELLDRHDAVFIGVGLGEDSFHGIPDQHDERIIGAIEWIQRMKLQADASVDGLRSVVVVGGGNTALDVVQETAGLGVENVTLVYRRSAREMPGYEHEWEGAKKLRVRLIENAVVSGVQRDAGRLCGVELRRAHQGKPTDESLRSLECDLLVVATGQERLRQFMESFPDVTCDERGRVVADPLTGVTGNPRIFAGGDCRNGGKEVVNAADEGQRAAIAIDALLRK
jgi:glutamate synthase (NADPH/NADH) small chain